MNIKQALQVLKAKRRMQKEAAAAYAPYLYKLAAQPPMPMDPSMMGGMPMDPSMMGGMPPQGMPMDPSMMGGMPPQGMPMDPSMMGGMPAPAPAAPTAAPAGQTPQETEQKVTNKVKTEQWMQHIDSYNYNLLKLMINLYEHLGIPVPAESLLPAPLGQSAPSAGDISGMMGAAATATSPQTPVDAMAEGDVTPPGGGGGMPMDPSMMDPSMMGGMQMDPSMMDPSMMEGDIPEDMPPMEDDGIKQSSWGLYDPYTGRLRKRWRSPLHKQAGVYPYSSSRKPSTTYLDVLNKLNKLGYFD